MGRRRSGRRRRVQRAQRLAQLVEEREASQDGPVPNNSAALRPPRRQRRNVVTRLAVERRAADGHGRRRDALGIDLDAALRHRRNVADALAPRQAVAEVSVATSRRGVVRRNVVRQNVVRRNVDVDVPAVRGVNVLRPVSN